MNTTKINTSNEVERYNAYKNNLLQNSPDFPSHKWEELDPVIKFISQLPFTHCLGSWDSYCECVEILLYFENEKKLCINKFIFEDDQDNESKILTSYTYQKRSEEEMKEGFAASFKIKDVYFGELDNIMKFVEKYLKDEL